MYPLTLRLLAAALPVNILWLGIAFSLVCLLAALLLISELFTEQAGPRLAVAGVAALLLYPTSFYFASVYTESLFLLLTAAVFLCARRGRWAAAGAAGFLASLTRLNGFLLAVPLLWHAWRAWRRRRAGLAAPAGAAAATLAGAAVFPLFLWARFGDPLLYVRSKAVGWGMRSSPIWSLIGRIAADLREAVENPGRPESLSFASQLASALLFVWLTVRLFRRRRHAEGLYVAASLLLLFHAGTVAGMDRYVLALFPAFLVIAEDLDGRPVLRFACMLAGVTLQVTFLHRFVHWIMVS